MNLKQPDELPKDTAFTDPAFIRTLEEKALSLLFRS